MKNKKGKYTSHAVVIFGYGIDENTGQDYYHVLNPWGYTWSDGGCGKVATYFFFAFGFSRSPSFDRIPEAKEENALVMLSTVYSDDD